MPTASSSRWLRSRKNRNTACYISQIETLLRKHEPVEKHAPSRVRVGFTIIVSKKLTGNSRQIISLWRMKSATTPKFCPDVQSEMCFESRAAQLRSTLLRGSSTVESVFGGRRTCILPRSLYAKGKKKRTSQLKKIPQMTSF